MPLVIVRTVVELAEDAQVSLLQECSQGIAKRTGKPEAYVMATFERVPSMLMAGSSAPACLIEVRGVGAFTKTQAKELTAWLCEVVQRRLGVDGARVYVNFLGFDASMWGFDGSTFG